jgi:UDP:flavonoid glycosyltransferase YjiC (YdhE family)
VSEKPDRVLYHPKCNFAVIWGMAHRGKSIMVSPLPGMAHPIKHLTVLGGNYGNLLNRLSFWFANTIMVLTLNRRAQKYKKDYPGVVISSSTIKRAMLKTENTFYALSPTLFPRPPYWPVTVQVVGYYERDKTVNWVPDNTLTCFLARHKKIMLITFGSMSNTNPMKKSKIIVDVLTRNNIPAIINTSWGGLQRIENSPEHIYFTDSIPYDWAFPKLYAVIHHGGAGTTHMSLKYGCPCLIVPHALDQFFWAKTVYNLKLGPEGLPIKNFNEKDFETRLLQLLNTEVYKKNALDVSERMKVENQREKLYQQIVGAKISV